MLREQFHEMYTVVETDKIKCNVQLSNWPWAAIGVRTYVEAVLAAMSQILAVLSAEALRRNLLSALQDSCNNKNNVQLYSVCNIKALRYGMIHILTMS